MRFTANPRVLMPALAVPCTSCIPLVETEPGSSLLVILYGVVLYTGFLIAFIRGWKALCKRRAQPDLDLVEDWYLSSSKSAQTARLKKPQESAAPPSRQK